MFARVFCTLDTIVKQVEDIAYSLKPRLVVITRSLNYIFNKRLVMQSLNYVEHSMTEQIFRDTAGVLFPQCGGVPADAVKLRTGLKL